MSVSVPEDLMNRILHPLPAPSVSACLFAAIELASLRGRADSLLALAAARGVRLPPLGRIEACAGGVVLGVRPERWLLLLARSGAERQLEAWAAAAAAVIDLSSALAGFRLSSVHRGDTLHRLGCRLDLDRFEPGTAAATTIAQTATIVARYGQDWLLLCAASYGAHLGHWLSHNLAAHRGTAAAPTSIGEWPGDVRP